MRASVQRRRERQTKVAGQDPDVVLVALGPPVAASKTQLELGTYAGDRTGADRSCRPEVLDLIAAPGTAAAASSLVGEAQQLSRASLDRAQHVDYATAGTRLSPLMQSAMSRDLRPYQHLRAAVEARLTQLGEMGEKRGLFMLAADMAMTEELLSVSLNARDQRNLRQLWDHLRLGWCEEI